MKKSPFVKSCKYDYKNKCDCSDDDNCGCDFPNNMERNFTKTCFETLDDEITIEKIHIDCNEEGIYNKKEEIRKNTEALL
jgi:hypothetical protein